jgi:hypothetical protein
MSERTGGPKLLSDLEGNRIVVGPRAFRRQRGDFDSLVLGQLLGEQGADAGADFPLC